MLQNILDISFVAHESNVLDIPIVADGTNVPKIQDVADGTLPRYSPRQRSTLGSLSAFRDSEIQRFRGAPAILDAGIARLCLESRFWTLALVTRFRRRESLKLALRWLASWTVDQWRLAIPVACPVTQRLDAQ